MNKKIKIGIVDNSKYITGALRASVQSSIQLKDQFDFIFILPSGGDTAANYVIENGFEVIPFNFKELNRNLFRILIYPFYLLQNARRIKMLAKNKKLAVLQINDMYNLSGAAARFLFGLNVPVITFIRQIYSNYPKIFRQVWFWSADRFSKKLIAVSRVVSRSFPKDIEVVYDGIFIEEKYDKYYVRNEIETIRLLYLGNYIPGKGQDLAIKAFKNALVEYSNMELHFFGSTMGLKRNEAYLSNLKKEIESTDVSSKVIFNNASLEIERTFKSFDIVLNFSESESFSFVCLESLYFGLPLIATKCGGPEEIIEPEVTGILVENRNIDEMAGAMIRLAKDYTLRKKLSECAYTRVREKFSAKNTANRLSSTYFMVTNS